ncbi:MAG: ribonuclease E/G [Rhizobiales bacterium]|nr:ribonuclease E/G [Hyphomicrobiales bacterium]MBI3673699.1 ribonuclease E/G [Hyphomicrobiales bacterium]
MGSKMLIDSSHPEETRVVVVRGTRIEEFDFESAARRQLKGNIYLAKVTRVEPSLQAAFIEYGGNRHGFLAFSEIHPDYYQIPLADRQALLREQEEEDAANRDDDDNGHDEAPTRRRHARNDDTAVENNDAAETTESSEPEDAEADPSDEENVETTDRAEPLRADNDDAALSEEVPQSEPAATDEAGAEASAEAAEAAAVPHVEHGVPAELGNGIEVVEEDPESQRIESIGAEDALEEVPQRTRRAPRRHYKIQEVVKRRQVILVQVVKEERGNKGAALTTFLSLAGRYCVLMPNTARGGGISRKITDAGDRRRLKDVARQIEIPQGMGLIVRTAGAQRTKTEIKRDYDYLLRLWESVRDLTLSSTAPALVYEEGSLIKRAIRDLYTKDVDEVHVEGDTAYREAKDFMKMLMPSHAKNVKSYKDTRPLFSRFQVESQLDGLYSPTVTLPSGGYMVINQTEALVSVDINSGKATREHNIEDTALRTNLEAADEVARQLRLRDLAGLVVIDFIDMEEKRNNRSVERRLKDALKHDRARIQVGRISHFGLLEMSRQRLRPGLLEGSSRTCPHCEGRGIVRSISSCGLSVLRAVEEHLIARKPENLTVKCAREVASYILNEKRDNLLALETTYGISVFIVASDEVKGSQAVIERAAERAIAPRRVQVTPVRIDSAYREDEGGEEEAETPAEAEELAEAESEVEEASAEQAERPRRPAPQGGVPGERREDGSRRRRRRGRRGGRGGRDEPRHQIGQGPELPGLGDQPAIFEPGEGPADLNAGEEATGDSGRDESPPPAGSGGRDRHEGRGRRRERGRHHGETPPRRDSIETIPSAESVHAAPVAEVTHPIPAPVTPVEPPAEVETQVRKWQPPAPTVTVAPSERKVGWWSKR